MRLSSSHHVAASGVGMLLVLAITAISLAGSIGCAEPATAIRPIGETNSGADVLGTRNRDGSWGLLVRDAGLASCRQPAPVLLEFRREGVPHNLPTSRGQATGYDVFEVEQEETVGRASIVCAPEVRLEFEDR
jgi:hypothetical protein